MERMKSKALFYVALVAASVFPVAFTGSNARAAGDDGSTFKVMSFNIRTLAVTDGTDYWSFRKDEVAGLIKRYDTDLAGLQEVYAVQARALQKRLPGYKWFGLPRDDGKKHGERCPIFYRTDRLELLDHGTFWLSETPEVKGSRSWDAAFARVVTWGKFRDRSDGQVFFHFNTHFDHQGVKAREMSSLIVTEKVEAIAGGLPAVITGDFNTTDDTDAYQNLVGQFGDARLVSETGPEGPEGTSRSFRRGAEPKRRIDYVFVTGKVKVAEYAVLDDTYAQDRRPSDHMPVLVKINIKGGI